MFVETLPIMVYTFHTSRPGCGQHPQGSRAMNSRLKKRTSKQELDLAWELYERGQERRKARRENGSSDESPAAPAA